MGAPRKVTPALERLLRLIKADPRRVGVLRTPGVRRRSPRNWCNAWAFTSMKIGSGTRGCMAMSPDAQPQARGRRTVVLTDNAHFHRPETSRAVTVLLQWHGRWLELVYLPAYSPELQPRDHLSRVLRSRVTHNHQRTTLDALQADAEAFLYGFLRKQRESLRIIGSPLNRCVI